MSKKQPAPPATPPPPGHCPAFEFDGLGCECATLEEHDATTANHCPAFEFDGLGCECATLEEHDCD